MKGGKPHDIGVLPTFLAPTELWGAELPLGEIPHRSFG